MKTKYIGLEGFGEIEDLSASKKSSKNTQLTITKKTLRFAKRVSKLLVKKSAKGIKVAFKIVSTNSQKFISEHKNISLVNTTHKFLKKKAFLSVVACASAITISCATVAGAIDGKAVSQVKPASTNQVEATIATDPTNSPNLYEEGAYYDEFVDETPNYLSELANTSVSDGLAGSMLSCVALYIDGEYIGAVAQSDAMALYTALDKVLVDYRKDYDDETTTEYVSDVEVKDCKTDESEVYSLDELMQLAYGKFSIALSTDVVYTQEIGYGTKVEYDDDEYISYEKVKKNGKNGKEEVTVRVTYVDGVQTEAEQTDVKVLEEAVDEVVVKGTRESVTTGSFMWPVPYTRAISSYFGPRWGTIHKGIDIADSGIYGQAIVASDGGTVTFAGWNDGGYGNYVVIDHGNGYKTLYAHCSSVDVSVGQVVSQGQTIAYIGSTGFSTGPHLHFEVQEYGTAVNPLNYLG